MFFYEYRDSIQKCEDILTENCTRLYEYVKFRNESSNSSKFTELDAKYANMKTYFDAARQNVEMLKKEYEDLTKHYLVLFKNNFAGEFLEYAKRQEPLRLKLIETMSDCQNLQAYFANNGNSSLDKDFNSNGRNSGPECDKRVSQPKLDDNGAIIQNVRNLKHAAVSFSSGNVSKSAAVKKLGSSNTVLTISSTSTDESSSRFKDRRKEIVCDICHKHFTTKQSLDKHSVIHEGIKPFTCNICDKSFGRKGNLKNHMHMIHESYRYSCSKCDRSFLLRGTRDQHERIAH